MSAVKDLETYDRVLKTALREIQSTLERQVELAFANLPDDPDVPLPWIGHFPQDRPVQKKVVVAALTCRQWAKFELPRWAPPLPLADDDIIALLNADNPFTLMGRRSILVAEYAKRLREMWWEFERADRFEIFCARAA